MKPKNLKFPFTWIERKPTFHEGVFIVPQRYEHHQKWEDIEGLFSEKKELHIEYCSGNGDWIIQKALEYPHYLWIAVEKQFERVRKIWSKMHNQLVNNLLIVCGEALTFTQYYLQDNSAREVYVNFPDPWPKARHAKHRLIQESFISQIARVVQKGGKAIYATDDGNYSQQMIEKMGRCAHWKSCFPNPYYIQNWEEYGSSWFQYLWKEKGRRFYYMQFEREISS